MAIINSYYKNLRKMLLSRTTQKFLNHRLLPHTRLCLATSSRLPQSFDPKRSKYSPAPRLEIIDKADRAVKARGVNENGNEIVID